MNRKLLLTAFIFLFSFQAFAQNVKEERSVHQTMLKQIKKDIEKNYYDPKFHGVDLEANYQTTSELIAKSESSAEMSDLINRFCLLLDDSHTAFAPPPKKYKFEYGWNLLMIGDKAFVTAISEQSDAYKKGIRVGDQIYMIDGFIPSRAEFRTLLRYLNVLQPRRALNILAIKPSGKKYKLDIEAKVTENNSFMYATRRDEELDVQKYEAKYNRRIVYNEIPGLSVVKMPSFNLTTFKVNRMIDRVDERKSLILDLRGNYGGSHDALEEMIGNFFEKEINVGKIIRRDKTEKFTVKPKLKNPYKGKLVVLIDNDSASAAEIFARIVQLEKRGTIVGDQSAGAVMQSTYIQHQIGLEYMLFYGIHMTIADLEMSDGQRLEKVGVLPDEKLLPTAQDLADKRDPALSRAAEILGFKVTPEQAGKIFPFQYDD